VLLSADQPGGPRWRRAGRVQRRPEVLLMGQFTLHRNANPRSPICRAAGPRSSVRWTCWWRGFETAVTTASRVALRTVLRYQPPVGAP